VLDPAEPISIGAMVGPKPSPEVRYLSHLRQLDALELIPALAAEFARAFGRESGGLLHSYRTEDARPSSSRSARSSARSKTPSICARRASASACRDHHLPALPFDAVRRALSGAQRVVVVEKAFSVGFGGVLSTDVAMATHDAKLSLHGRRRSRRTRDHPALARGDARRRGRSDRLEPSPSSTSTSTSSSASAPGWRTRRSGPIAENILRDLGAVASRIG
jgi:pyruvate ferredoxin oxidoreductase alpha subunit